MQIPCSKLSKDHPRRCGEHYPNKASEMWFDGSSPQMRGARWCKSLAPSCEGIIPADAGSTRSDTPILWSWRDHPRRCGEHPAMTMGS